MENKVETFSVSSVTFHLANWNETDGIVANEPPRTLPNINDRIEVFWPEDEK